MELKDTDWHKYHYHFTMLNTKADRKRYVDFYNRCLGMYQQASYTKWPPSLVDVNGDENINNKDVKALEYATTDAIQDVYMAALMAHPRHHDYILSGAGERAQDSLRIWNEESNENGWPGLLDELRLEVANDGTK